ncbi:MAG: DUF86 domain-containing protein [Calditrichaeota bacterium]|nr:DUF86 domain-containing protein [Calditrichota bacterium]
MPRDETYLIHVLYYARRIEGYVAGVTREEFDSNDEKKDAVVLQIGNIGEVAGKISEEFKKQHPEVKWKKMTGMRHRIFHHYHTVDWDIVWDTATIDVPELIGQIEPLVQQNNE